jgi:hypothetical protein
MRTNLGVPEQWPDQRLGLRISHVVRRSEPHSGHLQRRAHDLGRVDDAFADEIDIRAGLRVVAPRVGAVLEDLADDNRLRFRRAGLA